MRPRQIETSKLLGLGIRAWGLRLPIALPLAVGLAVGFVGVLDATGLTVDTRHFDLEPATIIGVALALSALASGLLAPLLAPALTSRPIPWRDQVRRTVRALPHVALIGLVAFGVVYAPLLAIVYGLPIVDALPKDAEVLATMGLLVGTFLVVAPLLAMFALAPQAATLEGRNAWSALRRATELARQNWVGILSSLFVAVVLIGTVALIALGVSNAAELPPDDLALAQEIVATSALAALFSLPGAMMTAAYHELVVRAAPWDRAALVRAFT